jgi:hypothetical protein
VEVRAKKGRGDGAGVGRFPGKRGVPGGLAALRGGLPGGGGRGVSAVSGSFPLMFPPDVHLRGVRVRSRGVGKEAEPVAGPW